jgi:hypothetical protein
MLLLSVQLELMHTNLYEPEVSGLVLQWRLLDQQRPPVLCRQLLKHLLFVAVCSLLLFALWS